MIGEVDLFQTHADDELYSQMNVNYLRLPQLPDFDHYGRLLDAVAKGEGFISTGEIVLPSVSIEQDSGGSVEWESRRGFDLSAALCRDRWGGRRGDSP